MHFNGEIISDLLGVHRRSKDEITTRWWLATTIVAAAATLTSVAAKAQSPIDIITSLPCSTLISPAMDSLPSSQWLPLAPTQANPAPFGIGPTDWSDQEYNALKARVRECGRTVSGSLARMVPTLLAMIDRQQAAQMPVTAELRRRRDQQQLLAADAAATLATIQQLPDAQDQVERLKRLQANLLGASPDTIEQVTAALEDAQVRRAAQAAAADPARQVQQANQAQLATQQVATNALAELVAIQQLPNARDQLNRLARLRAAASTLPSGVVQQIDVATATAEARQMAQAAAADRAGRVQQAEQELQAARLAVQQEEAAAEQRRQTAQLAQARAAALDSEQREAANQAKADEARLAAVTRERADIEARRQRAIQEQQASPVLATPLPAPAGSPPVDDADVRQRSAAVQVMRDQAAQRRAGLQERASADAPAMEAQRRLDALRADADARRASQAERIRRISQDDELLDSNVRVRVGWGYAPYLTLRQLLTEALAHHSDLERISLPAWQCAGDCVGLMLKPVGQPEGGVLLRQEGHDLFAIGSIINQQGRQIESNRDVAGILIALLMLPGVSDEAVPDLTNLQPR